MSRHPTIRERILARAKKQSLLLPEYYLGEGIESFHNQRDLLESSFSKAYSGTVSALGVDFEIKQRMRLIAWAGTYASQVNPQGAFVELGTGKGFSMFFLNSYLSGLGLTKEFFLFDSFQSDLPSSAKERGSFSAGSKFYAESFDHVVSLFSHWPETKLVKGWLPSSLRDSDVKDISFLHVDLNDGLIEVECIQSLWPTLRAGTVIVLDDFANGGRESQRATVKAFFDEMTVPVLATPQGQGLVIRP